MNFLVTPPVCEFVVHVPEQKREVFRRQTRTLYCGAAKQWHPKVYTCKDSSIQWNCCHWFGKRDIVLQSL